MKIKGISFGRGSIDDRLPVPGIGTVSEVFVGLATIDKHGRGTGIVSSIEFEPRGGLIIVKRTDQDGKPCRRWSLNADVKDHQTSDLIAFRLADNMTMYCDEDAPAQQKR